MQAAELNQFFRKHVTIVVDKWGSEPHKMIDVKVLAVSPDGLAIRTGGQTEIISLDKVISVAPLKRIRKKRVVKRWVRVIGSDASVRQHLADRHGILVSVLNHVDEQTAHEMHDNINHEDLGHRHRTAEERMADLDGTEDDDTEDEEE